LWTTFCNPPIIALTIAGGMPSRPGICSNCSMPNLANVSSARSISITASGPAA
jgi:hypothetical protein